MQDMNLIKPIAANDNADRSVKDPAAAGSPILVCLSGGVDSSVAAALLVEQGYRVTGAFMKQWSDSKELSGVCSWREDRRDALRVAAALGIELITLDFEQEYREWVMTYMFAEYKAGRTPNPDVLCNKYIKFGAWLKKAEELGFHALATGHYARVEKRDGQYLLLKAKDAQKDQTYFLHQLNQTQLKKTLFPVGEYTKEQVRSLAAKWNLPTANRAESMGICFVGEVPMKEFLEQNIARTPGTVVTTAGETIGTHDGLAFYTIGQRHGFGQQGSREPLYVVQKRFDTNELVVGGQDDPLLFTQEVRVENMHWVSGHAPKLPLECEGRFRHRQDLQKMTVIDKNGITLVTEFPQRAVTPGQFAVLYQGEQCLGGGIIA